MAKRILVVDDEPDVLDVIRATLDVHGYEVVTSKSAAQALSALAEDGSFDLAILDVMMPEMDGFELCRRMKADEVIASIPVVFLTAKPGGKALAEGLEAGALMYLQKPFNSAKLLSLVEASIG